MGLNLKIKRIIFTSLMRRSSERDAIQIGDYEIKQIAGRAGRYLEDGSIACVKHRDLMNVKFAMKNINETVVNEKMKRINSMKNQENESSDEEIVEDSGIFEEMSDSEKKEMTNFLNRKLKK